MSWSNTRSLTLGTNQVSSPYSALIGSRRRANYRISCFGASHLRSSYSEQIVCMSNYNTRISSPWTSRVATQKLTFWISVIKFTRSNNFPLVTRNTFSLQSPTCYNVYHMHFHWLKITCTYLSVITWHRGAWHIDVLILAMPEQESVAKSVTNFLTTSLNHTLIRFMSKSNTRLSSLEVSHVTWLRQR